MEDGVLVGAGEAGDAGLIEDDPIYAIELLQAEEVGAGEVVPVFLGGDLFLPGLGQRREHAGGAGVFGSIGEHRTLGDGAKALLIFSG